MSIDPYVYVYQYVDVCVYTQFYAYSYPHTYCIISPNSLLCYPPEMCVCVCVTLPFADTSGSTGLPLFSDPAQSLPILFVNIY